MEFFFKIPPAKTIKPLGQLLKKRSCVAFSDSFWRIMAQMTRKLRVKFRPLPSQ